MINEEYEKRINPWHVYDKNRGRETGPTTYGRYEVYRDGCSKQHYETWNTTGWAYNNNDITHWR
jgi:hypothetical protein